MRLLLALSLVLLAFRAHAIQNMGESLEEAKKYLTTLKVQNQLLDAFKERVPELKKQDPKYSAHTWAQFEKQLTPEKVLDLIASDFAGGLKVEEWKQVNEFYASATGQKLLAGVDPKTLKTKETDEIKTYTSSTAGQKLATVIPTLSDNARKTLMQWAATTLKALGDENGDFADLNKPKPAEGAKPEEAEATEKAKATEAEKMLAAAQDFAKQKMYKLARDKCREVQEKFANSKWSEQADKLLEAYDREE